MGIFDDVGPKTKGKVVTAKVAGSKTKPVKSSKPHKRGFVGKQAGPKTPPDIAANGESPSAFTGAEAGTSGVAPGNDSVDLDPENTEPVPGGEGDDESAESDADEQDEDENSSPSIASLSAAPSIAAMISMVHKKKKGPGKYNPATNTYR